MKNKGNTPDPYIPKSYTPTCHLEKLLCVMIVSFLLGALKVDAFEEDLIRNGGFLGEVDEWETSGDFYADSRFSKYNFDQGYAYLSNPDGTKGINIFGSFKQEVYIPEIVEEAEFEFYYYITTDSVSQEPKDSLMVTVKVDGEPEQVVTLWNSDANNGYEKTAFNFSDYIGERVEITFFGQTNGSESTVFRIDNVSLSITYDIHPPELSGPGTNTSPGNDPGTLTPVFRWDRVEGVDGYRIQISESPYGADNVIWIQEFDQDDDSHRIEGGTLQANTAYAWDMVSIYENEQGDYSDNLYFETGDIPDAPTDLALVVGSDSFSLAWTDNADDEEGFVIERRLSGSDDWLEIDTVEESHAAYTDSNAEIGVTYDFRIRAFNAYGKSEPSNVRSGTIENILPTYSLVVDVVGEGRVELDPPGGQYEEGTEIQLIATPAEGYEFSEWTGHRYSRSSTFGFEKGGALEELKVHFVKLPLENELDLRVAHSTPEQIEVETKPAPDWINVCEISSDLISWSPLCLIPVGEEPGNLILSFDNLQQFARHRVYPKVTTAPFLHFPVKETTPKTAPVSAVLDHAPDDMVVHLPPYEDNGYIVHLLGHSLPVEPEGNTNSFNEVPVIADGDYALLDESMREALQFNYVGVSSQGRDLALQYDGHKGYDYVYGEGTKVYPAATGQVLTDQRAAGLGLPGDIASDYMKKYHGLILYHDNGYCTVYMHLSEVNSEYVDKSSPDNWKPKQGEVDEISGANSFVGEIGNYCAPCEKAGRPISTHFHFEVWRRDGNKWKYADPYGKYAQDGTLLTPYLWIE